MSGFDWIMERMDPEADFATNKVRQECHRCNRDGWRGEMVRVGQRYYHPHSCYDRPYGEGPHKRGDF